MKKELNFQIRLILSNGKIGRIMAEFYEEIDAKKYAKNTCMYFSGLLLINKLTKQKTEVVYDATAQD